MPTSNPFVGLFRSEDEGGYSNQDMTAIADIIKSMMWAQGPGKYKKAEDRNIETRNESIKRMAREAAMQSPEWANSREEMLLLNELKKAGPAGRGDVQSYPSIVGVGAGSTNARPDYYSPEQPQPQMPVADDPFMEVGPPQREGPAPNSWEMFQQLNPNLDYEAVARQAGGKMGSFPVENMYGGAISEMPSSPEQEAQVASLMDYVKNQIPIDEINRKLDPRSRAYDLKGAELLLEMARQNKVEQAESAASKIEEIKANAAMKDADARMMLAEGGRTPGGYPFAGESGNKSNAGDFMDAADQLMQSAAGADGKIDEQRYKDAGLIKILVASGEIEAARNILRKYIPPEYFGETAPSPTDGTKDLARSEGTIVAGANGLEYR